MYHETKTGLLRPRNILYPRVAAPQDRKTFPAMRALHRHQGVDTASAYYSRINRTDGIRPAPDEVWEKRPTGRNAFLAPARFPLFLCCFRQGIPYGSLFFIEKSMAPTNGYWNRSLFPGYSEYDSRQARSHRQPAVLFLKSIKTAGRHTAFPVAGGIRLRRRRTGMCPGSREAVIEADWSGSGGADLPLDFFRSDLPIRLYVSIIFR